MSIIELWSITPTEYATKKTGDICTSHTSFGVHSDSAWKHVREISGLPYRNQVFWFRDI